jgi:hypothetical protein
MYKIYFTFLSYEYILDIVNKMNSQFQSEKMQIHKLNARIMNMYKAILRNFLTRPSRFSPVSSPLLLIVRELGYPESPLSPARSFPS